MPKSDYKFLQIAKFKLEVADQWLFVESTVGIVQLPGAPAHQVEITQGLYQSLRCLVHQRTSMTTEVRCVQE
jgi:hypothetical protein